ncbi:hypothetical protein VitviT2T_019668 [Vitis vinifera]|uniref:Histone deacetylase domain-containing protein n=1 Tax=Vitis vinifera TaxID=29760 RepID=A0ABY9D211_VITVI|nr:hypothetical protein VitviT2T_019668 [Vitis vinifera]
MSYGLSCFGNVAIAACYAQRVHELKRVLIIDFDVHHGNGTNDDSMMAQIYSSFPLIKMEATLVLVKLTRALASLAETDDGDSKQDERGNSEDHKAFLFIEGIEEQIQKLHEERASAVLERRTADNDEMIETQASIDDAMSVFTKNGSKKAAVAAVVLLRELN